MKRDYYEVLGVSRTVTEVELKKSFRRVAMKCHPDRCPDDPEAQERFKEAKEAYEILADSQKRAMYDRHGHAAFEHGMGGAGAGGVNVEDIFGDIFGNIFGMGGRSRRPSRGADLRYVLEVELEQAVFGTEQSIELPTMVACNRCSGSGSADGKTVTCTTCHGHGRVRMQNGIFSMQQSCPDCGGSGQEIADPCRDCHGAGHVQQARNLSVKVPAGVDTGDRIRLSGQGEQGPAGPGDLYIDIQVREHAIFRRQGDDLFCDLPIRPGQAALGANLRVPTLDGEVDVLVQPETQSGHDLLLRGRGVKSVRSGRAGDMHCRVVIETPVRLSARQRELLEEFEATFADEDAQVEHNPRARSWVEGVKDFWSKVAS